MTLIKWRNNDAFPSVFSNFIEDFFNHNEFSRFPGAVSKPSVNVRELEKSWVLEVAAPGFDKENFNIHVENDILTISAEKQTESEEGEKGYTRQEFNYSNFSRSFTLPESVKAEEISGAYANGILNVTLPKKEEAAVVKKTIKVS